MSKRRNDIILAVFLLLMAVAGFLLYRLLSPAGEYAVVLINGEESARFSLSVDNEHIIVTDKGSNLLVIEDGKAYVREATCPDGICVDHAPVSRVGETVVCLPHGVVIKVESKSKSNSDIDMVA